MPSESTPNVYIVVFMVYLFIYWLFLQKSCTPALKGSFALKGSKLYKKCKSKPQWGTISCQSEWLLSKSLQTINAGKGVEKRAPSHTVGGNEN